MKINHTPPKDKLITNIFTQSNSMHKLRPSFIIKQKTGLRELPSFTSKHDTLSIFKFRMLLSKIELPIITFFLKEKFLIILRL